MEDVTVPRTQAATHFDHFRKGIVGEDAYFETPFGRKKLVYADWVASGRLYEPLEQRMLRYVGPYVANTHSETSITGTRMTLAYHLAKDIIKAHVGANSNDCLISFGSGMTGVVNKFQRMLGLRAPEQLARRISLEDKDRPVVFITHMEHHSNQTSWLETIADVEVIGADDDGLVDMNALQTLLDKYADRPLKIASVTACSNVTGIFVPYHDIARMMHAHQGLCFVDFACSAPYVAIDMHPAGDPDAALDAIFFSPHKFLGGPGTSGILVFNQQLCRNEIPDHPGGGTVKWTNPWKGHRYVDSLEDREDGGTPAFLQTIRTALCIKVKEQMGIDHILEREHELVAMAMDRLSQVAGLHMLAPHIRQRLGIISFYVDGLHYNLCVRMLNDHYGIQVRGGCSCAGTYGHYLLQVSEEYSRRITDQIDHNDNSEKPGWVRLSLHPTMTDETVQYILQAIEEVATNFRKLEKDYTYDATRNEYHLVNGEDNGQAVVAQWLNERL